MNTTSITSNGRHQAHAAGAGTSAAIASLFGADAATPSFNDQLAQLNPLLRAGAATAAAPGTTDATPSGEPALDATGVLADAADLPPTDPMADWIKDWLPAAGAKSPLASQLRSAGQAAGRGVLGTPGRPLAQLRDNGSPADRNAVHGGLPDIQAAAQQAEEGLSGGTVPRRSGIVSHDSPLPHRPAIKTDSPVQALPAAAFSEQEQVRRSAPATTVAVTTPGDEPADAAAWRHDQPVKPDGLPEHAGTANRTGPALQTGPSAQMMAAPSSLPQAQHTENDPVDATMPGMSSVPAARPPSAALAQAGREAMPAQLNDKTTADRPERSQSDTAQQPAAPVAASVALPMVASQPTEQSIDRRSPAGDARSDADGASGNRTPTVKTAQQGGEPVAVAAGVAVPPSAQPVDRPPAPRAVVATSGQAAADEPAIAASETDEQRRPTEANVPDGTAAPNPAALAALPLPAPMLPADEARPRGRRDATAAGERVASSGSAGSAATAIPANVAPVAATPVFVGDGSASASPAGAATAVAGAPTRMSAGEPDASSSGERGRGSPTSGRGIEFAKALEQASLPQTIPTQGPTAQQTAFSHQAPLQVRLDTPVGAPDFRDALGVQVSVLARDGVEFAELSLNPPEMGPISVRIELDGQQAHIEFRVDSAATRAVLESGLPELASALREAGLTLTGGGVSDHARGQADASPQRQSDQQAQHGRQGQTRPDSSRPGADAELPRDQLRTRQAQLAGGVDLFA